METLTTEVRTVETLSPEGAAFLGGIAGAVMMQMFILMLIFYILTIIAGWKVFEKAGEKGWKSLIPIYNVYLFYKIVDMKEWFWGLLGINILSSIILSLNGIYPYATTQAELQTISLTINPIVLITILITLGFSLWASILYAGRTAKAFGKGVGFAVGIFFLPCIFWLILGFGNAKYNKKNLKA